MQPNVITHDSQDYNLMNTPNRNHRIYDFFAVNRILISRIIGLLSILLLLFTRTAIWNNTWIDAFMDNLGLFCVVAAVLGRIWSSLYICGFKNKQVISEGPYSAVRNPLYLFSFIGILGLGLSSRNILFLGLIMILFLVYYPLVILNEERRLKEYLGEAFLEYASRTPRFIPNFAGYSRPETYQVNLNTFTQSFLDGIWFFLAYIGLDFIKAGQAAGIIPVFLRFG